MKIDYSKTNTQQYGAGELCTCGPFIFGEEYVGFSGFGSVASWGGHGGPFVAGATMQVFFVFFFDKTETLFIGNN